MSETDPDRIPAPRSAGGQVWKGLCAGAVSGMTARCFVYPFDTVKAQLQLHGGLTKGAAQAPMAQVVRQICSGEGLRGFYRGFGFVLAGDIPGNMAYFGGYELGKAVVPSDSGVLGSMATGAIAQLIAGVVFTPIDIIKERMQVQRMMSSTYSYSSAMHAVRDLLKKDGPRGLMRGYWVTNSVWIPYNIMYISAYEASKRQAAKHFLGSEDAVDSLPSWAICCCAGGSSAAAAAITNPVDVVKIRLQVLSAQRGRMITTRQVARDLWMRERWRGLFAGTHARILAIAPEAAISWALYEMIMQRHIAASAS